MPSKRRKLKGRAETAPFVQLPRRVLRHPKFLHLPSRALRFLIGLLAQYYGSNNGDLEMTWKTAEEYGWKSRDTLNSARKDLLDAGFIVVSRQGGKNIPTLFAVTFYPIDYCRGKLHIPETVTPPDDWKQNP